TPSCITAGSIRASNCCRSRSLSPILRRSCGTSSICPRARSAQAEAFSLPSDRSIRFVQQHPALAVEAQETHRLDALIIDRAVVELDARQHPRQHEMMQVRRLADDVLARQIVATLFQ